MAFIDFWLPVLVLVPLLGISFLPLWLPFFSLRAFQWSVYVFNSIFALLTLTAVIGFIFGLFDVYKKRRQMEGLPLPSSNGRLHFAPIPLNPNSTFVSRHVVVVLMSKEHPESFQETAEAIAGQTVLGTTPIHVVLAQEVQNRNGNRWNSARTRIFQQVLGDQVDEICVFQHPRLIPGEVAGTGSNLKWALRRFRETHVDLDNDNTTIVTKVDSGVLLHPRYLEEVELHLARGSVGVENEPVFFQPHIHYPDNNHLIIRVMSLLRIGAALSVLYPWNLNGFTCYSIPYANMKRVGFQQSSVIGEDVCSLVAQGALFKRPTRSFTLGMPVENTLPVSFREYLYQEQRWAMAYPGVLKFYWARDPSWRSLFFIAKVIVLRYLFPIAMPLYLWGTGLVVVAVDLTDLGEEEFHIMVWSTFWLIISLIVCSFSLPSITLHFIHDVEVFWDKAGCPLLYHHLLLSLGSLPATIMYSLLQFFLVIQCYVFRPRVSFRDANIEPPSGEPVVPVATADTGESEASPSGQSQNTNYLPRK